MPLLPTHSSEGLGVLQGAYATQQGPAQDTVLKEQLQWPDTLSAQRTTHPTESSFCPLGSGLWIHCTDVKMKDVK